MSLETGVDNETGVGVTCGGTPRGAEVGIPPAGGLTKVCVDMGKLGRGIVVGKEMFVGIGKFGKFGNVVPVVFGRTNPGGIPVKGGIDVSEGRFPIPAGSVEGGGIPVGAPIEKLGKTNGGCAVGSLSVCGITGMVGVPVLMDMFAMP